MNKFPVLLLLLCIGQISFAQDSYTVGTLPQLNTSFSFEKDWKLNAKLESRQFLFQGLKGQALKYDPEYERADLEMVLTRSISSLTSAGGGYLIRLEDGKLIHRIIQQLAITQRFPAFRLAHRFRTDQTFESNEYTVYRLRYRASFERALNGFEIDPKEFYLKINNEYLGWMENGTPDLDIRGLAVIGYNISDDKKLETGIDYRGEALFSKDTEHLFWLNIALHLSF